MGSEWPLDGLDVAASGWRVVPFQEFVLKVNSGCNLSCDYCYMYAVSDPAGSRPPRVMSGPVVAMISRRIAAHVRRHGIGHIHVVLHGGEPLLAGAVALADIVRTVRVALPSTTTARFSVQTNGLLLNRSTLDTLAAAGVAITVSLDGTAVAHDRHRRDARGRGSYSRVVQALGHLTDERYRGLFSGLLCVVDLANDPRETYEALLAFAPPRVDFLLPHGNWSVPPPRRRPDASAPYGRWLVAAFDLWYGGGRPATQVRLFQEIVSLVLGGPSRSEQVGLSPAAMLVFDAAGRMEQVDSLRSAYPGAPTTDLDVFRNDLDDALHHPAVRARQIGVAALADECVRCPLVPVCGGGHYAHRYRAGDGFRNASVYCPDLQFLIRHVSRRVRRDVTVLRGHRPAIH